MHSYLIAVVVAGLPIAAAALPAASPATRAANAALAAQLNWEDKQDFDFATRGLVALPPEPVIKDADGNIIRDFRADAAFTGDAPEIVNASLWRNATLLANHGLFKVADGIWQIRGYDLSNMTIIAGKTGWILVDPLTTAEIAAAGLALVDKTLGQRPVTAIIYTHSHADHFGGAAGVVDAADVRSGKVPVVAPVGFLHHAVAENVVAGPAMLRRASYMFGQLLDHAPDGHVSAGLGPVAARGTITLIPPNDDIHATGDERVLDGVRFVFQLTPDTEAPAEMNFYLPDLKAVCMAENANGAMHNVLTPRGALVRDAHNWAAYLLEARRRFADADVMFTSHFWPRWGRQEIGRFLTLHAEAYTYLHDQTVRMMNSGLNGAEIAEAIELPPALGRAWFNRGNYGSLKFNARAVYQRYLGGFDGDPVNLDPLPRNTVAKHYVAAMGGAKKVLALAKAAAARGEDRWAATLLGHLTRAEPANKPAREALARVYEQLAYQSEAAPWRDFYLTGAKELRLGPQRPPTGSKNTLAAMVPIGLLLDSMATRVVPERALGTPFTLALAITDSKERHFITVGNGVMTHEAGVDDPAQATITVSRRGFLGLVSGQAKAPELIGTGQLSIAGDVAVIQRFTALFEPPRPNFPLVEP